MSTPGNGTVNITRWEDGLNYLHRYRTELSRMALTGIHNMLPEIDLNPEYQRGHVWTDEQQSLYVGALIEGRANDSGAIVLYDRFNLTRTKLDGDDDKLIEKTGFYYEVVDGKQRLTALRRFFDNEIPATFFDGFQVRYLELDASSERSIRIGVTVGVGTVKNMSRADIYRLYLALNSGGTVHTQDELERVRQLLAKLEIQQGDKVIYSRNTEGR